MSVLTRLFVVGMHNVKIQLVATSAIVQAASKTLIPLLTFVLMKMNVKLRMIVMLTRIVLIRMVGTIVNVTKDSMGMVSTVHQLTSVLPESIHVPSLLTVLTLTKHRFIYVAVNMMMVLGLLPIVGSPLPIMSYGGSSMMAIMFGLGIAMSCKIYKDVPVN